MPDALSKTVPIWCAVLNRALFPADTAYHPVQFPPNFLGSSEESQIEQRIEAFVTSLKVVKINFRTADWQPRIRLTFSYVPGSSSGPGRSSTAARTADPSGVGESLILLPHGLAQRRRVQPFRPLLILQAGSWRRDLRRRLHSRCGG